MLLQDFPYELITQVIANLNGKDVLSFIQCNSSLYDRSQQDSFWFDLCKLNGIRYCCPDVTWKELFCSGELSKMCPHLNNTLLKNSSLIQQKKQLLWSSFQNSTSSCSNAVANYILCLHPSCDFFGEPTCHTDHHTKDKHHVLLKLSPLHTLELWCDSCVKAIGFDGFARKVKKGLKSEQYVMNKITNALASVTPSTDDKKLVDHIIKGRQEIESSIFRFQFRHSTMHIVEKGWHTAWLEFISGKSNDFPGLLTNEKLLRSNGSVDPTLSLGQDFELIGSLTRWYIERIYGVSDTIISLNDLQNNAEYCKLIHSIRIRQQMNQVARYPPTFVMSD